MEVKLWATSINIGCNHLFSKKSLKSEYQHISIFVCENFPDLDNFIVKQGGKFFENLFQRIALFLHE